MSHPVFQQFFEIAPALFLTTTLCYLSYILYLVWDSSNKSLRRKRQRYKSATALRSHVRERTFQEQLSKPSFESRLKQFVKGQHSVKNRESKMSFWQRRDLEIEYIPPKPIELIRSALIRIKKWFVVLAK